MKGLQYILPCLLLVVVSSQKYGDDPYQNREAKDEEKTSYGQKKDQQEYKYYYGGVFDGTCGRDGLYYMDASTFVFCSNANAYYQPCAPGTRNSGQNKFSAGFYYGYSEFCDVNLVDFGYGAQYNGYVPIRPAYMGSRFAVEQAGYGEERKPSGYDTDSPKPDYRQH